MKILFGALLLLIYLPAFGEILTGQVVSVADGDTFTLKVDSEQYRIRLSEIDTPEKTQPWGSQAKQALSSKISQRTVTVNFEAIDQYGRIVGKVWLGNIDINRAMVSEGHAWVYRQYMNDTSLLNDETMAKQEGLGLWSMDDPIGPWEWRRRPQGEENSEIFQIWISILEIPA